MEQLRHVWTVQAIMWIAAAAFVGSGLAAWLVRRVPRPVRAWTHARPRWLAWMMLLGGLFLIAGSLAMLVHT